MHSNKDAIRWMEAIVSRLEAIATSSKKLVARDLLEQK